VSLRFRVATYNIHGGRPIQGPVDLPAIAETVAGLDADLVGVQEVHRYMPPPGVWQDQPWKLSRLLAREVTFRRSFGAGTTGYGNAIVSAAKPEAVRLTRLPGAGEPRALLEGRWTLDGRAFRFLNTHLGLTVEARLAQVRAIVAELRREDGPLILVGDLNALPDSEELRLLDADGLAQAGPPELFTISSDRPDRRIDYVLVSPHFRVVEAFTVPSPASDHLPMVAELEWAT
jgi:endonuclease/exonuclease/phosphatase family metal-dependent hydrolase